jgi:hypothetical protein
VGWQSPERAADGQVGGQGEQFREVPRQDRYPDPVFELISVQPAFGERLLEDRNRAVAVCRRSPHAKVTCGCHRSPQPEIHPGLEAGPANLSLALFQSAVKVSSLPLSASGPGRGATIGAIPIYIEIGRETAI